MGSGGESKSTNIGMVMIGLRAAIELYPRLLIKSKHRDRYNDRSCASLGRLSAGLSR